MSAMIAITRITLNDETSVDLPESGVVLFVGPNNAGKSQALRDISKLMTSNGDTGVVVRSAEIDHRGTSEEVNQRMQNDRSIINSPTSEDSVALGDNGIQSVSNIQSWWDGGAQYIVAHYFVLLADTESRLQASKPTNAIDLYEKNPEHPLHRLYLSPALEDRLCSISRDAFGQGLILDVWAGGSQWSLRVGEIEPPSGLRPDQDYLDKLRQLPLLHQQGDGVRSMIGLLLTLQTGHQEVSLVDEPEAFLHPPQARFLAKLLADDSDRSSRTVFLSTHSSDIVHGTLEGSSSTTVIRLRRAGNFNEAAVLDNDAVRRLWSDPLLRYSNLLEGLFTDAVVVCESDADCKFFASIRDTLDPVGIDARRPDILFTSCGGKHRMHVGLEALRAASVPVVALGDFDVLNDWGTLSRLITTAGGNAADLEENWRILNSALTSTSRTPSVAGMQEAVNSAFSEIKEVTPKSLGPVRQALKIESGWDRVKNSGLAGVPKGDPYNAASRLLEALRELRIHLIPVGEMEDFVPAASGHGPAWLAEVLEGRLHEAADGDVAREFFEKIMIAISD